MTPWTIAGKILQPVFGTLDRFVPSAPPKPIQLPRRVTPMPPTPPLFIEAIIERLDARKEAWIKMPCSERADLLRECMTCMMKVEEELARVSTRAKGSYGVGIGEERMALLPIMLGLGEYVAALRAGGCPPPVGVRRRRDGQLVAQVLPAGPMGLLLPNFRGEVWIQPGKPPSQGAVYRRKAQEAKAAEAEATRGSAGPFWPLTAVLRNRRKKNKSNNGSSGNGGGDKADGSNGDDNGNSSSNRWHKHGGNIRINSISTNSNAGSMAEWRAADDEQEGGGGRRGGGVALVLGAGNQVPVVALDLLHKLVADDEVVIVKTNPVNDYIGPLLRKAFAPLVDAGFLEFVYGGRETGELLTRHPKITSIHLTGSVDTYNDIVWGDSSGAAAGAAGGGDGNTEDKRKPLTASKRVTAELGNVTPYLLVPGGPWSQADMEYHAEALATALAHNAGHNCNGMEVLFTDAEWPLRPAFLAALKAKLAALPPRQPWYPGAREKYDKFLARFPTAHRLGGFKRRKSARPKTASSPSSSSSCGTSNPNNTSTCSGEGGGGDGEGGAVPWLLAEGLPLEAGQLREESWCGVLQEVPLPGCGGDPVAFMRAAVQAANTHVAGSLAAGVICHPAVQAAHPEAWDSFLSDLRYGGVCVNAPLLFLFGQPSLSWGAYPGNTPHDIGSGVGAVHNTQLFDYPQKSVLIAPWRYYPRPFWLVDHPAAGEGLLLPAVFRFVSALADGKRVRAVGWMVLAALAALRG